MISCTEFIPCYSELFTFLEKLGGEEEVRKFWRYLFEPVPGGAALSSFVNRMGIRGCYLYWSGTLNEEAAAFSMYLNEKAGWFMLNMYDCPSKRRLLQLQKETGFTPYEKYCFHCDEYRRSVEKAGLRYIYNFIGTDKASCSIFIYDPDIFEGRISIDKDTETMHRKASDNEYFHRDFHDSLNRGIDYLGKNWGESQVKRFFIQYADHMYGRLVSDIKQIGLSAIRKWIEKTYENEKSVEVLKIQETEDKLKIQISACPAVTYLHGKGKKVSKWYSYSTVSVFGEIAKLSGIKFILDNYDEGTGKAAYSFEDLRSRS